MELTDNPIFLRELRRLRHGRGWGSPAMQLALPIAVWGLAVPVVGRWGPWPPVAVWDLGFKVTLVCYLLATLFVPAAVAGLAERSRRGGTTEALRLTALAPGEEEFGHVLSVLVPLAAAAGVAALGHVVVSQMPATPVQAVPWSRLPRPPSPLLALVLALIGWSLFTAHVHFVALLSVRVHEASDMRGAGMLGMILVYALGIDVIFIGLPVKLLCLFELGPERSLRPPGVWLFLRRHGGAM